MISTLYRISSLPDLGTDYVRYYAFYSALTQKTLSKDIEICDKTKILMHLTLPALLFYCFNAENINTCYCTMAYAPFSATGTFTGSKVAAAETYHVVTTVLVQLAVQRHHHHVHCSIFSIHLYFRFFLHAAEVKRYDIQISYDFNIFCEHWKSKSGWIYRFHYPRQPSSDSFFFHEFQM